MNEAIMVLWLLSQTGTTISNIHTQAVEISSKYSSMDECEKKRIKISSASIYSSFKGNIVAKEIIAICVPLK